VPTKRNQALIYRPVPAFLRRLREKSGMTQREFAKRIGQKQWWVHRSEIGSRRVDVAEFIEWAHACDLDPRDALGELAQPKPKRGR
jgi:transcriptional regulator with XRE-family HTH domain